MKIEEAIKQNKKFKTEIERAVVNLTYTYNWLNDKFQNHLKSYGISNQQYNILRILRGQFPNPASVNLLKDRMLDKNSDVSRMIDRLISKQLVERKECPEDRRSVNVFITQNGLDILQKIDEEKCKMDQLVDGLTEQEAAQLNDLLDKLRKD